MTQSYDSLPLSQLLALGDPRDMAGWPDWPDYLALGFTQDQVPDLIRLAGEWGDDWWDSNDEVALWGPVHAWRALGQLRAASAVEPLVALVARTDDLDEDWIMDELPAVLGLIGPPAVPALADALADPALGLWARAVAAHSLACVGNAHAQARDDCIAALTRVLAGFADLDPTLNAFLISYLVELQAVDAAPLIERAYAADAVDWSVPGDWEDVQVELGLLEERLNPRPNYFLQSVRQDRHKPPPSRKKHSRSKKKAKRKRQKAARRKQRKRKKR
jgi:hypothetical protein